MIRSLLFHYIPYGVIDVLLTVIIIAEIVQKRGDLIWSNVPLLVLGIISLNRKLKREADESSP
jgi:hypothetical protein